eukprot:1285803-Rhodomonas_salina.1
MSGTDLAAALPAIIEEAAGGADNVQGCHFDPIAQSLLGVEGRENIFGLGYAAQVCLRLWLQPCYLWRRFCHLWLQCCYLRWRRCHLWWRGMLPFGGGVLRGEEAVL